MASISETAKKRLEKLRTKPIEQLKVKPLKEMPPLPKHKALSEGAKQIKHRQEAERLPEGKVRRDRH